MTSDEIRKMPSNSFQGTIQKEAAAQAAELNETILKFVEVVHDLVKEIRNSRVATANLVEGVVTEKPAKTGRASL